jgi:hypothetical protein
VVGGLGRLGSFCFAEALALCVGAKQNVPNALAKIFPCGGLFLFFLVSVLWFVLRYSVGVGLSYHSI